MVKVQDNNVPGIVVMTLGSAIKDPQVSNPIPTQRYKPLGNTFCAHCSWVVTTIVLARKVTDKRDSS